MSGLHWLDDEVRMLHEYSKKHTLNEVCKLMNRSKSSVKHKADKEGIDFCKEIIPWKDIDEKILSKLMSDGKSYQYIADVLQRSRNSVKHKAYVLGLSDPRKSEHKEWSKEETAYLEKYYNKRSTDFLSKKFDRSPRSIKKKAESLNLVKFTEELSLKEISRCFNSDICVVKRWIEKFNLPVRVISGKNHKFYQVSAKSFWYWAEEHKDIVPWDKYEDKSILPQPDFVRDMRNMKPRVKSNHGKPISEDLVRRIGYDYYGRGISLSELSDNNGRTIDSIKWILRRYNKLLDIK